ncbi:MAG: hypothetical protein RJA51_788, partial [Actinomycetota bacterium]
YGDDAPMTVRLVDWADEEGARFGKSLFGSSACAGHLDMDEARRLVDKDGVTLADALRGVGLDLEKVGDSGRELKDAAAYLELHIEQGPVLEQQGVTIGAVTGVQGISWREVTINGQSNHAGTTPMGLRHDPAYAAAAVAVFMRQLATRYGGNQVCTVGKIDLHPNLVNVVPASAVLTLDVRNTDEGLLRKAESEIDEYLARLADEEGVSVSVRTLARFEPVEFDGTVISLVESTASRLDLSCMRLPSGAGHDAQMLARVCPTGMVFVQSHRGISHNPAEHTDERDLVAGCDVLLQVLVSLVTGEET